MKSRIQNVVNGDGTVSRLFPCDCGTPLYRKNLSTGEISIRVPDDRHQRRYASFEPSGNPSVVTVACPNCGMKHKIGNVAENMTAEDGIAVSEDVIE